MDNLIMLLLINDECHAHATLSGRFHTSTLFRDGTSKCSPGNAELKVLHRFDILSLLYDQFNSFYIEKMALLENVKNGNVEFLKVCDIVLHELLIKGSHQKSNHLRRWRCPSYKEIKKREKLEGKLESFLLNSNCKILSRVEL